MTNEAKKQLRLAKKRLAAARCTCLGPHDPFWVRCERTLAEIDVDNAFETLMAALAQEDGGLDN